MTTEFKQAIFQFVSEEYVYQSHSTPPKETVLSDFIAKAEHGNEMATIFLAEWYHDLVHRQEYRSDTLKKLKLFFMGH